MAVEGGGASVSAFDAYVIAQDNSGVPSPESAAEHARLQAEILAADLGRLEEKSVGHLAELEQRLQVLRADLDRADAALASSSAPDYPQLTEILEEIHKREAKAAAQVEAIKMRLSAARDAAEAADSEATQLEAEAARSGSQDHAPEES